MQVWGKIVQNVACALNQHPRYGGVPLIAKTHTQVQNQGVNMKVAPLITTLSDSLAKFLLSVLKIACLEVLGAKGGVLRPKRRHKRDFHGHRF